MSDISCEIKETLLSVPAESAGWCVEVNLVSWEGREPKYDIRKWNEDHSKSSKGLTLSKAELLEMFNGSQDIIDAIGED